jgi:hypothetical protein
MWKVFSDKANLEITHECVITYSLTHLDCHCSAWGIMKEVNELQLQIASKNTLFVIDHQGKTFNTNIAKVQAQNVFVWPLDDIELVDWTTTNKFARLWFCEDIHHSSSLKLAIEKVIQKSTNAKYQASCFKIIQTMKKRVCVFTQKGHTVDILPYSQLCCFPY